MFELILRFFFVIHIFQYVFCHYTDKWAVKVDGDENFAKKIASERGFQFVSEIIPGYYSFRQHKVLKRSLHPSFEHHESLASHPGVVWLEQQQAKKRVKRDLITFNDPLWPQTWYLHSPSGNDMRVMEVYGRYNISGRGVKVTILDDGLEKNHPDLVENYDPGSSYDINDDDNDPQPRYDYTNENRHGTRCAGEVASMANNSICGVGVAYNAKIGGVRMLDGDVTDEVEARSLGLNPNHVDIYSVSWGPEDNGATVDGPGSMAREAILNGIQHGRSGLGNIFVWASGNGGLKGDSCSCDGYCNSIHTLTVSSATESGTVPWYSEPCANTLATTYSSGSIGQRSIVTTDLKSQCTNKHTGTSATAPLVAGMCALLLEANPRLNWREVQYIVFLSARKANLQANDWVANGVGREVSHHFGYGLMDATRMVDLALNWTLVPPQQLCTTYVNRQHKDTVVAANQKLQSVIVTNGCQQIDDANNDNNNNNNANSKNEAIQNATTTNETTVATATVTPTTTTAPPTTSTTTHPTPQDAGGDIKYLEHVECVVTVKAGKRGAVELFLTSPTGTTSQLLIRRNADASEKGFLRWSFMSTHSWGENPRGQWTLVLTTHNTTAVLVEWFLNFYGVSILPVVYGRYLPFFHSPSPPPIPPIPSNNNNNNNRTLSQNQCHPSHYLLHKSCVLNCPLYYYRLDHKCLPCKLYKNYSDNNKNNNNDDHFLADCKNRIGELQVNSPSLPSNSLLFPLILLLVLLVAFVVVVLVVVKVIRCVVGGGKRSLDSENNLSNANNRLPKRNNYVDDGFADDDDDDDDDGVDGGGGGVGGGGGGVGGGGVGGGGVGGVGGGGVGGVGGRSKFFQFMKITKLSMNDDGGDEEDGEDATFKPNKKNSYTYVHNNSNNKRNNGNNNNNDNSKIPLLLDDDEGELA